MLHGCRKAFLWRHPNDGQIVSDLDGPNSTTPSSLNKDFRPMAAIIRPGLFLVIERFPDRRDEFKRLYAEQEPFRALCENYRQCRDALRYWARNDQIVAKDRRLEYQGLLLELEGELRRYRRDELFTKLLV
jgi:hypothetical protein